MAAGGDYLSYRQIYNDISGSLVVLASDGDATLVTAKIPTAGSGEGNYTIFIQRIFVWITTSAAQNMSFEDSSAGGFRIANIPATPGADTKWSFDFGSRGVPLTEKKNFLMNVSAAGLAGHIEWEGYTKMTGAAYLKSQPAGV